MIAGRYLQRLVDVLNNNENIFYIKLGLGLESKQKLSLYRRSRREDFVFIVENLGTESIEGIKSYFAERSPEGAVFHDDKFYLEMGLKAEKSGWPLTVRFSPANRSVKIKSRYGLEFEEIDGLMRYMEASGDNSRWVLPNRRMEYREFGTPTAIKIALTAGWILTAAAAPVYYGVNGVSRAYKILSGKTG